MNTMSCHTYKTSIIPLYFLSFRFGQFSGYSIHIRLKAVKPSLMLMTYFIFLESALKSQKLQCLYWDRWHHLQATVNSPVLGLLGYIYIYIYIQKMNKDFTKQLVSSFQ